MEISNIPTAVEEFLDRLADAQQRVLLLDYDGTLAPFTPERDKARMSSSVRDLIQNIIRHTNTRVVMITGRSAKNLKNLLDVEPCPEIWGTHGRERLMPNGAYHLAQLEAKHLDGLIAAQHAATSANLGRGRSLERKPGALALHWRGLSPAAARHARNMALQAWESIALYYDLILVEFDCGLELRPPQHNKGDAVRTILDELDEECVVAYLGDDQTDEDAFRALRIQDLSALVRTEFRETSAKVWLRTANELMLFLGCWLTICGGVQ